MESDYIPKSTSEPHNTALFFSWRRFQRFTKIIRRISIHRRLHFTLPLLSFAFIFAACSVVLLISLGVGFPYAFPLPRTFFVATLISVPILGFSMCAFCLGGALPYSLRIWWHYREHYVPLAFEVNEYIAGWEKRPRRRPRATSIWLAYLFLAVFGVHFYTYELPIDHRFKATVQLANRELKREGYGNTEKVFIGAMFHNNANVLPYWVAEVSKLINYLGPDNVFVSIVESYSSDHSPSILRGFETKLQEMGVRNRILTQDTSILHPPSMATGPPRIDFLAATRNLVLEPLMTYGGYNRVLFSNDVFVEAESMVELLETNGGEYDMACGLDFQQWGLVASVTTFRAVADYDRRLYDIWVIRDCLGRIVSGQWPYFSDETSFAAIIENRPVPVFTCWNGIVSISAEPFLPVEMRTDSRLSASHLPSPLPPTHPNYPRPANQTPATTPPLRFRGSAPDECFSSESFNLPYDLRRLFGLERIYVNPRVITAYKWRFYLWFKYALRHWATKWFMKTVEHRNRENLPQFILSGGTEATVWDGGECHPGGALHLRTVS
ncbi:hypothetical protein MSAN_01370500 [Mycena sanguinolenta]|uniref:Glycosyltransferase family 69 protein n=1 Tax=Mycena sanguinolenta TaxID=230812 RepID=A0A8H6YA32_9AGAR|nr:hypothetical protein MSAN_01370500 [Mycena sanguinolenta]